ncbi:MAG: hypothetical protein ACM3YM_07205 [Sphingomonadales bacterium]
MNPVKPEELSALLDGELSGERAREVRMRIAADPALGDEFRLFEQLDAEWTTAAQTAQFSPVARARLKRPILSWLGAAALVLVLVLSVLRLGPKFIEPVGIAFGLQALGLVILLAFAATLTRPDRLAA